MGLYVRFRVRVRQAYSVGSSIEVGNIVKTRVGRQGRARQTESVKKAKPKLVCFVCN